MNVMNEFEKSVNPIPKYPTILLLLPLPRPCFQFGLFFCLAAGLRTNYRHDFHETWYKSEAWAKGERIQFWSGFDFEKCVR